MTTQPRMLEPGCEAEAEGLGYTRVFDVIDERIPDALAKWEGEDVILVKVKAWGFCPSLYQFKVMKKAPPPKFQIGDVVTFTNDYGVSWKGLTIIGSEFWQKFEERRYFYGNAEAPWYSNPESSFTLERSAHETEAANN